MLKVRLQRVGRVHEPSYRLVVTDSKNATKSGKYLENLGAFDTRNAEASVLKTDRSAYWLGKGAQASTTVHNLLISKKLISGKKKNALPLKKAIIKEAPVEAPKEVVAEAPAEVKTEEAPVETVVEEPVAEEVASVEESA